MLCWFAAYYQPGRLTGGFDVWIRAQKFDEENQSLQADLSLHGNLRESISLVAVMNPDHRYKALWGGREIEVRELSPGTLDLRLNPVVKEGQLEVIPR